MALSKQCGPGLRAALLLTALFSAGAASAGSILFIGNSFTFAFGSPARYYRPESVTDLNSEGQGGVPALFKSFTVQAGLAYQVFLETHPGVGLDWHLQHKRELIGRGPWDEVVMHGYSTLDAAKPGDAALLIDTTRHMTALLQEKNSRVSVRLLETWPRADETYLPGGAWHGKPIEAMAGDVQRGYAQALAATPAIKGIIPVGDAWLRAMHEGIADPNPFNRQGAGMLDLWADDNYHASLYGTYLEALTVFGTVTGVDPRSLGTAECSAFELGITSAQAQALQNVAYEELAARHLVQASGTPASRPGAAARCVGP